jgi:superfamily II DNA or RNA helicase
MRTLQDMLEDISFESLPPAWQDFDLVAFAPAKRLWPYQQDALRFALKALWKYYEDFRDFREGEPPEADEERKAKLWKWYRDNGLGEDLDISLEKQKRDVRDLLQRYYPVQHERIPYRHFVNRMGFWMATGSGKSLVLVKLIEILWGLMRRGEIPVAPVLVLSARDDLLDQLKAHVEEFNRGRFDFRIQLANLKSYPDRQHSFFPLVGEHELTAFFYRADNLSDEQKERIVDFRNYENDGRWYVLLDEAHKGDKEESRRQHIYGILSRHGFLFNFSATFTDPRDIVTTVYNFNLSEFVRAGYSKHIVLLRQETRAFGEKEDYTGAEKQRVVLKALLMLAYLRRVQEALPSGAYHRPLLLILVHSVNTEDADLRLVFREIERVGRGEIDPLVWEQAGDELRQELIEEPEWLFEEERFRADISLREGITPKELLRLVYNAPAPGEVEVLLRPSNRQEMAFKLKSAEQPFALVKIGDISGWLKEELRGYEIVEGYEDEGFFRRLNEESSPINLLMGSRAFYEGWDSNRPNVILYIHIGAGVEARKFILQSVGRGVRIEPLPGKRQRLLSLHNSEEIEEEIFEKLQPVASALETLFVFGTRREVLNQVFRELDREKRYEAEHRLELEVNRGLELDLLLMPTYRDAMRPLAEDVAPRKFEVAEEELERLQEYVGYLNDPRLLICRHHATPQGVRWLQASLRDPNRYFNTRDGRRYGRMDLLIERLLAYFRVIPQEVDRMKPLEEEIRHFRHIRVFLRDIRELIEKVKRVKELPRRLQELSVRYESRQLSFDEMLRQIRAIQSDEEFAHGGHKLYIKRVAQHYYLPLIHSENERIDWIRHIIRHPSEVRFLNDLEKYLGQENQAFASLVWAFSKIDEALDEVYVPYYDPRSNRIRKFFPDFVFWLRRGSDYAIVFVDPKGMQQADYAYKVDGFRRIFLDEEGRPWVFRYQDLKVHVHLLLYTEDVHQVPEGYRAHWFDHPSQIAMVFPSFDGAD